MEKKSSKAGPEASGEGYVTVREVSDPAFLPLIKSVLDGANIPFHTRGEGLLNLFPSEALGPLLHRGSGEVAVQVPRDRLEEAKLLLSERAVVQGVPELED